MPHIAVLRAAEGDEAWGELAARLQSGGVELTPIGQAELSEESPFDLILSLSSDHRKVTSHPTFLMLGETLSEAVSGAGRFSNLCSYDGYFAQEGAMSTLRHLAVSLDKPLIDPAPLEEAHTAAGVCRALKQLEAARVEQARALTGATIDVILRTGGRSAATVRRAVRSLQRQTAGRIRLIVVRHGHVDLDAIGEPEGAVGEIHFIDAPGANRGIALAAGLSAVSSPLFAILDDDDYLLSSHFAGLLTTLARSSEIRAFAYCDILRRLEQPDHLTGASAFDLLREGSASGPLTSILERFSSHCFLTTSASLDRFRFRHWDLATAEDSLLVAALLRVSQPLHSPNATAVYCQGAGAASDFAAHPQRRSDEAALHAETFAWRAEIENRFPDEAPDPLRFLGAALRRREATTQAVVGRAVAAGARSPDERSLTDGSLFYEGAFGGDGFVFVRVPLTAARASGEQLYFENGTGAVQVGPQPAWGVGLRVDISDYAVAGCATRAVAVLPAQELELSLALLDAVGTVEERTQVAAGVGEWAVEVVGETASAAAVGIQAGPQGALSCRVSELWLGYAVADLASAFGTSDDQASPTQMLAAMIASQIIDRPLEAPTRLAPVDYRGPRNLFRHVFEDGPLRDGAPRVLGTGLKAWDYFAQVHLPSNATSDGGWVRVDLAETREPFAVFLVDDQFTTRLSRTVQVQADKARVELWLPALKQDAYLVFQSGASPQNAPLVLNGVATAA